MYLIYKILKEIRYIMRSKSMKRLITLALLIVLLSMLCSRVFAFELTDSNNNVLTFGDYRTDELNTVTGLDNFYKVFLYGSKEGCYFMYFLPKEFCANCYGVFENAMNRCYFYVPDESNTLFTYYRAKYYKKSDNSFRLDIVISINARTGELNDFQGVGGSSPNVVDILYSDIDFVSYSEYQYCNYSLSLSTEEQTEGSVFIYTNWLDHSKASAYNVYMEMYPNTANSINVALNTETNIENTNQYRYYFEAEENGDYKFYFDYDDGDFALLKSQTITVSNIITNTGGGETGGGEQGGTGERWL